MQKDFYGQHVFNFEKLANVPPLPFQLFPINSFNRNLRREGAHIAQLSLVGAEDRKQDEWGLDSCSSLIPFPLQAFYSSQCQSLEEDARALQGGLTASGSDIQAQDYWPLTMLVGHKGASRRGIRWPCAQRMPITAGVSELFSHGPWVFAALESSHEPGERGVDHRTQSGCLFQSTFPFYETFSKCTQLRLVYILCQPSLFNASLAN